MQLTKHQASKIKQSLSIDENRSIIRLDVSEEKDLSPLEESSNIYCIDSLGNIIWQVEEKNRPFESDMFTAITKNDKGEIIAYRFSGFSYKIKLETGEAKMITFNK